MIPYGVSNPAILAFQNMDIPASKEFHKLEDEPHKVNNLKKSFDKLSETTLLGAISGITNTCMILALAYGLSDSVLWGNSTKKWSSLFVSITFALLSAQGLLLAYTEFMKRREYNELYLREKRREKWECDNYIEGEQREMVNLYVEKGLSRSDAENVITILSKDKGFFVELMMKEELEMIKPDETVSPIKHSLVLFASTVLFGLLPVIPFMVKSYTHYAELEYQVTQNIAFSVSAIIAFLSLCATGVLKSNFTVTPWWKSCIQSVIPGAVVSAIMYIMTQNML